MKNNILKYILIGLIGASMLMGCSDMLDTSPYDQISDGNMWKNKDQAEKAVNGIFSMFYNTGSMTVTYYRSNSSVGYDRVLFEGMGACSHSTNYFSILQEAAPTAGDGLFSYEWKWEYEGVNRTNNIIANISKVPDLEESEANRLLCIAKFMRAYFYYRLNVLFQGVPIYLEPTNNQDATKPRSTVDEVWQVCIDDLTDCINNEYFPENTLNTHYGSPSKGAAYALRGMVNMWKKDYASAISDFEQVGNCGYGLWTGNWEDLFKPDNEKNSEMILPLQYDETSGYCDNLQLLVGARDQYDCWTELFPSAEFVDSYENADGSEFKWSDYIPDWDKLEAKQREVFFLRDHMKTNSKFSSSYAGKVKSIGQAVMDKYYLDDGNEARIKTAYANRDPRLQLSVFTPYSTSTCFSPYYNNANIMNDKVYRWPYLDRGKDGGDLWSDKRNSFFYIYKKYNITEKGVMVDRLHCFNDYPLIRYTQIWLEYAEALNESGRLDEAIQAVNKIRERAGMPDLTNGGSGPNAVLDKEDMAKRIRYESRVELCLESVNYFEELRWGTYKESKFENKDTDGLKAMWGEIIQQQRYWKEYMTVWPVPRTEVLMNPNLEKTPGWNY